MNEKLITSQNHIDADVVAEKSLSKDYVVIVGKIITINGIDYRVVIDGHHSLRAAINDKAIPTYHIATVTECDREGIDDVEQYLESHWMDGDYRDAFSGEIINF
jgi:hypothetical protein